jgi:hypothetical protein
LKEDSNEIAQIRSIFKRIKPRTHNGRLDDKHVENSELQIHQRIRIEAEARQCVCRQAEHREVEHLGSALDLFRFAKGRPKRLYPIRKTPPLIL